MKWCFLMNNAILMRTFGQFAHEIVERNEECLVLISSKIAEYQRKSYFPKEAVFVSKVDWCTNNYDPQQNVDRLPWRVFFPIFDRFQKRVHWDYEGAVKSTSQVYQFLDSLLQKERPDVIIGEPPAGLFAQVAYTLAERYHIPFFGLTGSSYRGRTAVHNKEWTNSHYEETFQKLSENDISAEERAKLSEWIQNHLSHKEVPYTEARNFRFSEPELILYYLKRLSQAGKPLLWYWKHRKEFLPYDYESEAVFQHSIRQPFEVERRQFRIRGQKRFYKRMDERDSFFLFPLQYQPEASTSVLAMHFVDQVNTIRNIAFSLPFPYKLYVKEHPSAVGRKPDSFYKELLNIPQVVLLSHSESVPRLLEKAKGVITLTSKLGLEGALSGKPVYVLGNVFYLYHPLCRKVYHFDELRQAIEKDLKESPRIDNLEDINMRFLTAHLRYTVAGEDFKEWYIKLREFVLQEKARL